MSRPCRPRTSIASGCPHCRILLFAGIDLVIALVLLLGNGFTVGFWAILAIGIVLAVLGLLRLYSKPPE